MGERTVAAVVVTYNRQAMLMECLRHLRAQSWPNLTIWVVDNASTDGTREAMTPLAERGDLRYVRLPENLGGAGGFQEGVKRAVEDGCDYVWLMDDDCMPRPDALEMLMRVAEKRAGFGFLSSRALWTDGGPCRMNLQRDLNMKNLTVRAGECLPCGAATFVSLLVPSRVVRDVGLPIGAFFIWADDLEYTRRISRKYPCWAVGDSVVEHRCPTNNGGNIATDTEDRIDRYRCAYRNEVYLYRREGLRGWLHLAARTVVHVARVLLKSRSAKGLRIRVILGSTVRGLTFRPEIEYVERERSAHEGA